MGIVRAETIARMRKAVRAGLSQRAFERQERGAGRKIGRRTDVLADWRLMTGAEKKKGLLRFVRKDRYPTTKTMAALSDTASAEFLYQVRVQSVLKIGERPTERFVNIMSDVPMTPEMAEAEVIERWREWEKYAPEIIEKLQSWSAFGKGVE